MAAAVPITASAALDAASAAVPTALTTLPLLEGAESDGEDGAPLPSTDATGPIMVEVDAAAPSTVVVSVETVDPAAPAATPAAVTGSVTAFSALVVTLVLGVDGTDPTSGDSAADSVAVPSLGARAGWESVVAAAA